MEKIQNLTKEERETLNAFYAKCVAGNVTFPSFTTGLSNVTVQELVHERTIKSLEDFGDTVEKKVQSSGSSFKSRKGPLKFGNVLAASLLEALHLIIKEREFESQKASIQEKLKELDKKIENAKTPAELRSEAEAEKALLTATLAD